jgi:ubiquinone/menaquinone biosynthesis C-methylase UbiE
MTPQVVDDFEEANRRYLSEFRAAIGPINETVIRKLGHVYVAQERSYLEKVRFILHHMSYPPQLALEVGSSAGGFSAALGLHGIEVIGVEPSTAGVNVSRQRANRLGLTKVSFELGVGEQLPYADESFDLVGSLAVLEHVQDVDAVVRETFRVLKPGGKAYFEVPNNLYPFEGHYKLPWVPMMPKFFAKRYVKALGYRPEFLDELHYMSRSIVFRHFRRAGFSEIQDLYSTFIAGKVSGAPWGSKPGRLHGSSLAGWLAKIAVGSIVGEFFLNRAVFLIATKPARRT